MWWDNVIANTPKTKEGLGVPGGGAWVDVQDVAEAHVRALEREAAGGERITASAGECQVFDIMGMRRTEYSLRLVQLARMDRYRTYRGPGYCPSFSARGIRRPD